MPDPAPPEPSDQAPPQDLHVRAALASELSFTISDPHLPDNPLVWVNPAFEQVTGYRAADVLGTNCRFLQGPGTDREAIGRISAAVRAGRTIAETVLNYRKDGTPFWNQLAISPITDADGRVTHFVGIQADVTDRVEAQRASDAELRAARQDRDRLALLSRVSEALTGRLDYAAGVAALAETVVGELADWGLVAMLDERGRVEGLHVVSTDPALAEAARRLEQLTPSWVLRSPRVQAALAPGADPMPQPAPIDVASLPERTTPEQLALLTRLGLGEALVVPLHARERTLGVIVVVRTSAAFGAADVVTAGHVGHRAGLALENLRLYERERSAALTLQRRMLPELAPVPGLDVAATYLPADHPAEVGGDWFDVIRLPDGAVGLAVGDVVGHDMGAAAAMGQLRSVLRSVAWSGEPAGRVVARLDELVRGLGMADVATCVYLRLDDGALEYSRAGHPPPLVLGPDGTVTELDGGLRTPVGIRCLTDQTPQAQAQLPPGAILVAYSDGLVERRDRTLRDGLAALRSELAAADPTRSAAEVRDHLIAALLGPAQDDDVCLLVVKRPSLPR